LIVFFEDAERLNLTVEAALPYNAIPTDNPAEADAIVTWRAGVDAGTIARAGRCLAIIIAGPGCGPGAPRVDLEAARAAGIYVTSVPDYASEGWAAENMALIGKVAVAAELAEGNESNYEHEHEHEHENKSGTLETSVNLRGIRLGIVGLGQVGRRVARLARRRGMELWGHDPFCPENPWKVLGVEPAPLEELLGIAQIVSLHVPLGPATRGMLHADRLNLLQRRTALVNAAAPELIDLAALPSALDRRRPAVAAFLTAPETSLPFPAHPHLIHRTTDAASTPAARAEALRRAIDIARMTCRGDRPPHLLIDPPCPRQVWMENTAPLPD
jgi:phosphoglycerate dehydrogenase-like enzyme